MMLNKSCEIKKIFAGTGELTWHVCGYSVYHKTLCRVIDGFLPKSGIFIDMSVF